MKNETKWELFLDDERFPEYVGVHDPVVVARNSYDAQRFVEEWGIPEHIYFDHDLGGSDTAIVFINWLEGYLINGGYYRLLPEDFTYSVHSMNPVGAENIKGKMDSMIDYFNKEILK